MPTRTQDELPPQLQDALNRGLLERLPITFLPFTRQQLREWPFLFPYERQSVLRLLLYVASLNNDQFAAIFQKVVQLENKMGVRNWQFSLDQQTILNASLLARSPYYQEWRIAVQKVFDAAEEHAQVENVKSAQVHRCIILILPRALPLEAATVWRRWQTLGRPIQIESAAADQARGLGESLLVSSEAGGDVSLLTAVAQRPDASFGGTWMVDAGSELVDRALSSSGSSGDTGILLSFGRLATFRQNFLHEMNTMSKDLSDADSVYARLRKTDVAPWCPPEVASQAVIREFLRSLYLSGNGALLFGNSFVEWGASEAFRRARASFFVAQFGVRSRPKPFTSVAIFENQDEINPIPAVDDLAGSSLDAQVLALYVWLAASRYVEYQHNTVCLCIAEGLSQAYLIAAPEFVISPDVQSVSLAKLRAAVREWMTDVVSM